MKLTATNVSKRFERREVLRSVSLEIESGRALVITGPNGSGKTTLMRILSGLMQPTSGEVLLQIDGSPLEDESRRQAVGFVTPDIQIYPELSPLENLRFFNTVRGLKWDEAEAQSLLEQVGLRHRGRDPVREFSSGMKQRMKLACALEHRPPVLLLDEPGSNLDEAGRKALSQVIEGQRGLGITVLATNDAEELAFGDTLLTLG